MKHTKREWIPLYNFLDRARLTAHLSEMAAQGWLLTSISSWSWKYRRTEPRKLKFAVTFFAGAGRFSPAPAPGLDTFRDYCAQAGWQVAASMDQVQVFYNEDENAVPLETDSALELANIQKSIGGPLKKSYLALLVLSLFQLGFGLWRLVRDPVDNIGNSSFLLSAGAYLPLSVLVLWGLLAYRRWLRKAGAAAETGAPLPDLPSAKWLSILTMVWSALLVLASFATVSRSAGMVLLLVGMLVFYLLVGVLANLVRKGLQRLRCPAWGNFLAIIALAILLTVGALAGLMALVIGNTGTDLFADHPAAETYTYQGITWSVYHDPIPLRIEDLTEVDYDRWSTEARADTSFLGSHGEYRQDARLGEGQWPELRYDIVTVKVPFLYDLCKQDFIDWVARDNDQIPAEYQEEYRSVDPSPWGAEEVLQVSIGDEAVNQYLLCWPDRLAEVHIPWDWDLTAEQMAIIGEKLAAG